MGWGAVIDRSPAKPDPRTLEAFHCWAFMGGWYPERLGAYAAIYPVDDWEMMTILILKIRDFFDGR